MIPETLWLVFSNRWLEISQAPADAEDWLERGFLRLFPQGKLMGYVITLPAYCWIVDFAVRIEDELIYESHP